MLHNGGGEAKLCDVEVEEKSLRESLCCRDSGAVQLLLSLL